MVDVALALMRMKRSKTYTAKYKYENSLIELFTDDLEIIKCEKTQSIVRVHDFSVLEIKMILLRFLYCLLYCLEECTSSVKL